MLTPKDTLQEKDRTMPESPASVALHMLLAELNATKSQWEDLQDVIALGYADAYDAHLKTLNDMHKARLIAEQKSKEWFGVEMFIFSVVSVGFAGGLVGGLIAPWVREAQKEVAETVIRQGVQGMATRTMQQSVVRLIPERAPTSSPSVEDESLFVPASPDAYPQITVSARGILEMAIVDRL